MSEFETTTLASARTERAPDGSRLRALLRLERGSVAQFELDPGQISRAVAHRSVEEIWYVVSGRGELWRRQDAREEIVTLAASVCVTIPAGTGFQFRATGDETLCVIGVTMPPWPGAREATLLEGRWTPSAP